MQLNRCGRRLQPLNSARLLLLLLLLFELHLGRLLGLHQVPLHVERQVV